MIRNVIIILFLVAGAAFVAYRVGYSRGQDEPLSQSRAAPTPAETPTEDVPVEDPAVPELERQVSACTRALTWFIPQLATAEGMADAVKDALLRGDESAAEDSWNSYYQGRSYDEYYVRALKDDVALCGLTNKYIRQV